MNKTEKERNIRAERVALAISAAVVLAVLAAIGSMLVSRGPDDVRFTLTVSGVRPAGEQFHVLVRVGNDGQRTTENVQVIAELLLPGQEPAEGEQQVQFLAGGAEEEIVFVFADDPSAGELTLRVGSYTLP